MNAIKLESTKPHLTDEEVSGMNGTKLESVELGKEMEKVNQFNLFFLIWCLVFCYNYFSLILNLFFYLLEYCS